jgi:hypothetical protein
MYEVPSESMTTAEQVRARVREIRRTCLAFLDAWPDQPHLETTVIRIPVCSNGLSLPRGGIWRRIGVRRDASCLR